MIKDMTAKSNALIQGTRSPGVPTLRTVGHMAGDKMVWSLTVKLPGFSPERLPSAGCSMIQGKREGLRIQHHCPTGSSKGQDGPGAVLWFLLISGITLPRWPSPHSLWGVTASQPLPLTDRDSEYFSALDGPSGCLSEIQMEHSIP